MFRIWVKPPFQSCSFILVLFSLSGTNQLLYSVSAVSLLLQMDSKTRRALITDLMNGDVDKALRLLRTQTCDCTDRCNMDTCSCLVNREDPYSRCSSECGCKGRDITGGALYMCLRPTPKAVSVLDGTVTPNMQGGMTPLHAIRVAKKGPTPDMQGVVPKSSLKAAQFTATAPPEALTEGTTPYPDQVDRKTPLVPSDTDALVHDAILRRTAMEKFDPNPFGNDPTFTFGQSNRPARSDAFGGNDTSLTFGKTPNVNPFTPPVIASAASNTDTLYDATPTDTGPAVEAPAE